MNDGRCESCMGTGQDYEGDIVVGQCIICDGSGFDPEYEED